MPETPYFLRLVFAIDKKSTTGRLPTNNLRSLIAHKVEETAVKTLTVCDVYVGGKVRVSEFMIFLDLQHCGSK